MTTNWTAVFRKAAPKADPRFVASFQKLADEKLKGAGLVTLTARGQFLGHMQHETAGFREFHENMNYSARRICQVWPGRFPTLASAAPYAHNPRALANRTYANRMGNGPVSSDDGWQFRGGGGYHHTGRFEYERVKRRTGHDADTIRDPSRGNAMLDAALSYAVDRGMIPALQRGDTKASTRILQGGTLGADDRAILARRWTSILANEPPLKERTNLESKEVAEKRRTGAAVGALGSGGGSATTQVPDPVKAVAMPGGASLGVALIIVALACGAAWWMFHRKAKKHQAALDAEKRERIEAMTKEGEQ